MSITDRTANFVPIGRGALAAGSALAWQIATAHEGRLPRSWAGLPKNAAPNPHPGQAG